MPVSVKSGIVSYRFSRIALKKTRFFLNFVTIQTIFNHSGYLFLNLKIQQLFTIFFLTGVFLLKKCTGNTILQKILSRLAFFAEMSIMSSAFNFTFLCT